MKLIIACLLISNCLFGATRLGEAKKIFDNKKSDNKYEIITYQLWLGKYYFSAVPFAKMYLHESDEISPEFEEVIKTLVIKTGTENFLDLSYSLLKRFKSPTLNFIAGIKYYQNGRNSSAFNILAKVPEKHRFYPEAKMMRASILALKGKFKKAREEYNACNKSAAAFEKLAPKEKIERYYEIMKESCTIHQARFEFKQKNYQAALDKYEEISKNSYRWPYLLMEKAWTHYYLGDFNRSLGLLVTYKSPLLDSYFFAETEVLSALSYYRMCLWNDADTVINNYYKVYTPSSNALKKILTKHKRSHSFFLDLVLQPVEITERDHPYIRHLVTQIRKKVKFNIQLGNHKRAKNEILYIQELKNSKFKRSLINELNFVVAEQKKRMNYFIKKEMFGFINDIFKHAYSMFNLKLEVLAKKREYIYSNKDVAQNEKRGDIQNVNRKETQQFFEFEGEFWADELGDYSFGLSNKCIDDKKMKEIEEMKKKEEVKDEKKS